VTGIAMWVLRRRGRRSASRTASPSILEAAE
jgi:hypothetical protein